MAGWPQRHSLLTRDQKLFLELTPAEADVWISRVFDRLRPHMNLISAIVGAENAGRPLNLEMVLEMVHLPVREVAVEMADDLLTPARQRILLPLLNTYCDELLAQGRNVDAIFIQQGLIAMQEGALPGQNPLLVEVCLRSIVHQVSLINSGPHHSNHPL